MLETAVDGQGNKGEIGELTDGFHLIIDALKLNGIKTIYNVPSDMNRRLVMQLRLPGF